MTKYLVLILVFFFGLNVAAQHQDKVDFIRGEVSIEPVASKKIIKGGVTYWFKIKQDVDSLFLDAKNMDFEESYLNDKSILLHNSGQTISIKKAFKKGEEYKLELFYSAAPKQTVYFLGWDDSINNNEQIWTQGQGKYTSHWLPSFDAMEEKIEFSLLIKAPKDVRAIANGTMVIDPYIEDDSITWHFDMQKPMSSYLLAFVIGNYEKQELKSKSGIPIENYYYPKDSLKVEPTYRYTKEIFDFLEDEIGVPYPWQNYKQIPVRDFLYAGMENTTATIFSDGYVIDSTAFVDKNYVNVNAHELAHQWFGNLVTEKDGNHHWLHEGFATYYAQLAEKEIFGDDHYYWKLYESLYQLEKQTSDGEGQSLLDPKASSLTFYEKGAWALFMLHNKIGDKAFKKGVKKYLKKFQFQNVTVGDFLKEMESASGKNLSDFRLTWLENKDFPIEKAKKQLIEKSSSIKLLSDMEADLAASQSDDIDYVHYWDASNSVHLKKHLLRNYPPSLPEAIYIRAFESDTIPVRQALLLNRNVPKYLDKSKLESFLKDPSYVTTENALLSLWQAYPDDQKKYLDATENVVGLPNKNVRLLWLTLSMLSENYKGLRTKDYFDELSAYTDSNYSFEIRQNAFFYLKETFGLNGKSLTNLVKATDHHTWQFKKFARNLLDELLEDPDYKERLQELAKELNPEESRYLNTKLKGE